jgi:branched-chain amino acid transport system substrate-binding protein
MYRPKVGLISVAGIASLAALSACGTTTGGGPSSGGGGALASCHGTITVATDLPLTGGDATDGPFPAYGAQLAVTQANSSHTLGGCTLKYVSKDDSSVAQNGHDPAQGAANITALAGDSSVVGVVGPFNSSVALTEIPIASQNHLPLISPANTNPGLTQAGTNPAIDTASLYKGVHSYFRVIATDTSQAEILAYVATKELNATKAYLFDDQQTYGKGLRLLFQKFYTQDGGTVVGSPASLPSSTKTFSTQLSEASTDGAKMVFFGGTTGDGCGLVRGQMASAGLSSTPFLGGDGCEDTKFLTDAGAGANGAEATSAPDVTKLGTAAKFFSEYAAAYSSLTAPYNDGKKEPYTAYGYDAMNILIKAIKAALLNNGGKVPPDIMTFRDDVITQLHSISYDGAIGHTTFDSNGDTTNTGFTLYQVQSGAWTTKETLDADTSGKVSIKS